MSDPSLFKNGDVVQLNELSPKGGRFRSRQGIILGPSRVEGKFRVLWKGLKRPQLIQGGWPKLAECEIAAELARDIAIVEDELESIRQLRFARHLNMPRPSNLEIYEPANARDFRVLQYILAGIVGLAAAVITIAHYR